MEPSKTGNDTEILLHHLYILCYLPTMPCVRYNCFARAWEAVGVSSSAGCVVHVDVH